MRYRFVDRILEIDAHGAGTIATCKTFPRTEDYLDATFRRPDEVPASLVLESLASAGALLLSIRSQYRAHALLLKVDHAHFSRPVLAGDRVTIRARVVATQGAGVARDEAEPSVGVAQIAAQARAGEEAVATADILFFCVPLAWTFGSRMEDIVTDILALLGITDARL